jgi:hypothetical protein
MSRKLKYLPLYSKKSKKSPYFQTKYGGRELTFYYGLRTKLVHEKANTGITDDEIGDYWILVEEILEELFGLRFDA